MRKKPKKVRIVLADDHAIVREGLRSLLEKQDDMEVVGEAENGRQAVRLAQQLRPDVVVMDISMPELNGIEATRQLCAVLPDIKVVALSIHSDRRFVAGMLQAGASGFLLKDSAFAELVSAIASVHAGRTYLSPRVAQAVVKDYVRHRGSLEVVAEKVLTSREREVLQLLAEGLSNAKIAARLFVSPKTVETHRRHIMQKLGFHSVAELTKYAVREGLTSLEL